MIFIKDIFIKGFQSHQKETYLELSHGVNVLIGNTGSGKSAVVKALMWLFKNRPSSAWESYKSFYADETEVAVGLADPECHIGRVRNKVDNYYYIEMPGKPIQEFKAFGKGDPPKEVLDLLKLAEVNYQSQMALPFLMSQSSGAVGRFLNEVANLEIIDRAISGIGSQLGRDKASLEIAKSKEKDCQEAFKKYDWVLEAEKEVVALEKEDQELSALDKKIEGIEAVLSQLNLIQIEKDKIIPVLKAQREIKLLEKEQQAIKDINDELEKLYDFVNLAEVYQSEIVTLKKTSGAKREILFLVEEESQIKILREKYLDFRYLVEGLKEGKREIDFEQKQLKIMKDKFESLFPDICPLCEGVCKHKK